MAAEGMMMPRLREEEGPRGENAIVTTALVEVDGTIRYLPR